MAAPLQGVLRLTDEFRAQTVRGMLSRHHTEAATYWTQLVLSAGIATFGLVLNSGAVIIGAMLVAPLMGPIIELAMGLAVGSALLALRSAMRVGISVAVVVLAAALLTRMLPFQDLTTEVAARTSPTVLDLMVASFCALTAAFVTLKPNGATSTAAGTSIAISLVPPLCASGFGVGVQMWNVAWGAMLLFIANLSAIMLFAVVVFLLAGFGTVKAAPMEREVVGELERKGFVVRVATGLNSLFGSRHATVFKLVLPVTLVAAVFIPLQRALTTVSTEVRARQQIAQILSERPELKNALVTNVGFDQDGLTVRLVVVAAPERAKELEDYLRDSVSRRIAAKAAVSVVGVADAASVERLAAAQRQPIAVAAPPPPPVLPLSELQARVVTALKAHYPEKEAGTLLRWTVDGSRTPALLRLTHFGAGLGPPATRLLGEALAAPLHGPVEVADEAFSPMPVAVPDGAALVLEVSVLRARLTGLPTLRLCAELPALATRATTQASKQREALKSALGLPVEDVHEGEGWTVRVSDAPCWPAAAAPAPAPAPT